MKKEKERMKQGDGGGVIVTLNLIDWLSRVRGNLDALQAMDQSDPDRVSIMRETEALFDAAKRAGLHEWVDEFRESLNIEKTTQKERERN